MEALYADDLILIVETQEGLERKFISWKLALERSFEDKYGWNRDEGNNQENIAKYTSAKISLWDVWGVSGSGDKKDVQE